MPNQTLTAIAIVTISAGTAIGQINPIGYNAGQRAFYTELRDGSGGQAFPYGGAAQINFITTAPAGDSVFALGFDSTPDPFQLDARALLKINPVTGSTTTLATLPTGFVPASATSAGSRGLALSPTDGLLYSMAVYGRSFVDNSFFLLATDPATGATTSVLDLDGGLSTDRRDIRGLAFHPTTGQLFTMVRRGPSDQPFVLAELDLTTGQLNELFPVAGGSANDLIIDPVTGNFLISSGGRIGFEFMPNGTRVFDETRLNFPSGPNQIPIQSIAFTTLPAPSTALTLGAASLIASRRRR